MKYRNLNVLGTSHIAQQSIDEIEEKIASIKPEIIAIELDKRRYHSLLHPSKKKIRMSDIFKIGVKAYILNSLGAWAEKKMGKMVGIEPGADMLTAIRLAKEHKIKLALIDQDIEITMKKLSKRLTWREKGRVFIDIIKSIIFRKSEMKELGIENLDLTKVPPKKLISKMMVKVKKRYPNFYQVLVVERNYIMALKLSHLMEKFPEENILAVVGAGHEEEILKIIKNPDANIPGMVR